MPDEESERIPDEATLNPNVMAVVKQTIEAKRQLTPQMTKLIGDALDAQVRMKDQITTIARAVHDHRTFLSSGVLEALRAQSVVRPFLPPSFTAMVADINERQKLLASDISAIGATWKATLQTTLAPFADVFRRIAEEGRRAKLADSTGWLPHSSTPFGALDPNTVDRPTAAGIIEAHYRDNWDAVETQFRTHLEGYDIDEEAKETFDEALRAHRAGLYRAVPRLLFPEIERVVAVEFYDGKHSEPSADGKKMLGITSLKTIRSGARDLPASDVLAYDFGMQLFERLETHLYEKVGEEPDAVARFAADPVPNRHASLHGIVSYRSSQYSVNTLIMNDFVFHLVSRMKTYIEADVSSEIPPDQG